MKKQLMNIKHFVQDINLRGEKSDVLNSDLLNAEKKVELIKQSCQSTEKKISACLQGAGIGTDPLLLEKRQKKMPEIQLFSCFQELGESFGDSVLGQTFTECGEIQRLIGAEIVNYELEVEKQCLSPLNSLLESDIPNVYKYRKQLNKATQDRDNYRQRYQTAMKQSTQSSASAVTFANKLQTSKKELEESNTKVEQSKDAFASEMYSFLSREPEISQVYLRFFKLQASFYKKVSEILENSIPTLEELIADTSQKPCFGIPLEEHLRVTEKEVAIVIETCIGLLFNHLNEEGLFRIPGSASKVKKLRCSFDAGIVDIDEYSRDPHTVAGCLKSYLRELPEPLLTHQFYHEWIGAAKVADSNLRLQALWQVSNKLPKYYFTNLKYMIKFLAKLSQNSNHNKMSSQNIAIAVAPSLIWPPNVDGEEAGFGLNMTAANFHSVIVDSLITYADWFFPGEVDFVTLPVFGALVNGDSEENHNPIPMPRTTVARTSKKPAPPAPSIPERTVDKSDRVEKLTYLNNNTRTSTLPRSGGKISKPERPSIKERTFQSSGDVIEECVGNRSSYGIGSLDRKVIRNGDSANDDKRKPAGSGSRSNRNSVEKPSVPPPDVPVSVNKCSKSERPSSTIERPSVPPPERPQRSIDMSRSREGLIEDNCQEVNVSKLYPDLSLVEKPNACDKLVKRDTIDSIDTNISSNSDKDSITFVDESEEELLLDIQKSRISEESLNDKCGKSFDEEENSSIQSEKDHRNYYSDMEVEDLTAPRSPNKVKPPRPQPPVMKPKPNLNENTYL